MVLQNPLDASGVVVPAVTVFDIDMYDNPKTTIDTMHAQGRKVMCYFSAGTHDSYRPDSSQFAKADLGSQLSGWPGDNWLHTYSQNVRNTMAACFKVAADKGCDAIDSDNMDGYETYTGFPLTTSSAPDYLTFLSVTGFSEIIEDMSLDGWVEFCTGTTATTATNSGR